MSVDRDAAGQSPDRSTRPSQVPTLIDQPTANASQPEWRVWSWEATRRPGTRGVSWLGVLLVVIGICLFINQLNRSIDLGSLFLVGFGIAFGAAWLIGGSRGATVPCLVLLALGIQGLLSSTGELHGPGWSAVAIAIALLLAWAIGLAQHRRRTWALWVGAFAGLYGLARVSTDLLPGLPDIGWLAAVALIVLGLALLLRRGSAGGVSYW